jgi:hypothetical protein
MKVCVIAVALAVTAATGEMSMALSATAAEQRDQRVLDLLVIDQATRKPIPGVSLAIQKFRDDQRVVTDERGHCLIPISREIDLFLIITARADGFVPKRLLWKEGDTWGPVPSAYTMMMEKPVSIGGVVRDDKGHQVKNALVLFEYNHRQETQEAPELEVHGLRTDNEGRWRYDLMTPDLEKVSVIIIAPGFPIYNTWEEKESSTAKALLGRVAVFTLRRGLSISGHVLTETGEPIRGASVFVNDGESDTGTTEGTDSEGSWSINELGPEPFVLTAQAPGYAPDLARVVFTNGEATVDFRLKPAQKILIRVLDEQGQPIRGAQVYSGQWRGFRTLGWDAETDADGRVCFSNAPTGELTVSIEKTYYVSVNGFPVSNGKPEYVIPLKSAPHVRGKVLDATTGKPVQAFTVIRPVKGENDMEWVDWSDEVFTNGSYDVAVDRSHPASIVQIEAEGYKSAVSRISRTNQSGESLDFKLERAAASQ